MSTIWFTSDQHFGHKNIVHLCNRPFESVDEMDEVIIQRWNDVVKPDDIVFVLGDFAYKNSKTVEWYTQKLMGQKHLILGNHDKEAIDRYKYIFQSVEHIQYVEFDKQEIVMFHYPILSWRHRSHGAWHLFGHVHEKPLHVFDNQRALNVGVDVNDFRPISLEQVKAIISTRHAQKKEIDFGDTDTETNIVQETPVQ